MNRAVARRALEAWQVGKPARLLDRALSIADLRLLAARRLPRVVFDFIEGGAGDEITLRDNEAAFQDWQLVPRVAVDVSHRSTVTDVVGRRSELPFLLAPTGFAGFFWPSGEVAAASAAAAAGIPFCLSTNSVASLEVVAESVPDADRWFQLYVLKDRDWMNALVARAKTANYRVLCITSISPFTGAGSATSATPSPCRSDRGPRPCSIWRAVRAGSPAPSSRRPVSAILKAQHRGVSPASPSMCLPCSIPPSPGTTSRASATSGKVLSLSKGYSTRTMPKGPSRSAPAP